MSSFNNILFPFDSSIHSEESFSYAIDLAKNYNSKLIFLYTLRLDNSKKRLSAADLKKEMNEASAKRLESIKKRFDLDNLIKYEFHTEIGFLASRVLLKIKEEPIDLLVVEKDHLAELNGATDKITCPIMIIPY